MTMMNEMTIGEMPMETSFVGASAAPSQAPAVNPERIPKSWSFFERDASWVAGENSEGEGGGILLRSENQRINRRRSNPPIRTATGTQKWISLRTLVHQPRVFWSGSVAFIFDPLECEFPFPHLGVGLFNLAGGFASAKAAAAR